MRCILLVHPDADAWLGSIDARADVTPVGTAQAARAYLAGTAFDLVLIGPDVEGAEAIAALRDVLGLSTPIEPVADARAVEERLGASSQPEVEETEVLGQVRDELARVAHALNNPLAVVAGNAQLGLEMAGALDTDDAIVEALQNIKVAAADLEVLFAEVAALRTLVDRVIRDGESG